MNHSIGVDGVNHLRTSGLTSALVAALEEFRREFDGEMALFAIDFHPWNGTLGLAALTSEEVAIDPGLLDPAEMASWKYFDLGANLRSWQAVLPKLSEEIKQAYSKSPEDVDRYFVAVAQAVVAPEVTRALEMYRRAATFRISVAHPDTNKEFATATS